MCMYVYTRMCMYVYARMCMYVYARMCMYECKLSKHIHTHVYWYTHVTCDM